jgi:hypothetical protein
MSCAPRSGTTGTRSREERIEHGKIKIVEKETFPVKDHQRRPIQRDVWEGALKAAAKVEKKYGLENLGPWDDFEWGMLNGKLSALRWALADDWDMLDTWRTARNLEVPSNALNLTP